MGHRLPESNDQQAEISHTTTVAQSVQTGFLAL